MADIRDVSQTIACALNEVGVSGTLDVVMDGAESVVAVGEVRGDDVEIVVTVKPIGEGAALAPNPCPPRRKAQGSDRTGGQQAHRAGGCPMKRRIAAAMLASIFVVASCHAKPNGATTGDGIPVDVNMTDGTSNQLE